MARTAERIRYPEFTLAGVRLHAVNGLSTKDLLRALLAESGCQHVVTANAEYVRRAAADARLREIIDSAALVVPDGMPVVWVAKLAGAAGARRVTGHDMVEALSQLSVSDRLSLFLLGAAPGVAAEAARTMERSHPGVRIAGIDSPPLHPYPFPEEENRRIVQAVNASGADALLVAFGCPKQDLWLADHREELNVSIAVGVGCVLDVLAGKVGRAPRWLQAASLEWTYRLAREPGRLWNRYLRDALFLTGLVGRSAVRRLVSALRRAG